MADKAISQLNAATSVTSVDLFVLEQSGEAKKLTGQILENWLVSFADGHGGIQSITKTGSTGTNPVIDTYTILLADETTTTFQVVNGIKGDTGDQTYVWIRYSHVYPNSDSDMGTSPDEWIGIYSGTSSTAPTHYTDYTWYQFKGDTGATGAAATITAATIGYQQSDSGSVVPEGSWVTTVPTPVAGKFLWTRIQIQFNTGSPITAYSVARYGIDGTGAVSSVNSVSPDQYGNVQLVAGDIQALDSQSVQAHLDDDEQDIADLKTKINSVAPANKYKYYHVDCVNGSDSNDGITAPLRTLDKLFSLNLNNDLRVYFDAAGTYSTNVQYFSGMSIHLVKADSVTGDVTIDFTSVLSNDAIQFYNCYVHFKSVKITWATSSFYFDNSGIMAEETDFVSGKVGFNTSNLFFEGSSAYAFDIRESKAKLHNISVTCPATDGSTVPIYCRDGEMLIYGTFGYNKITASNETAIIRILRGYAYIAVTPSTASGHKYGLDLDNCTTKITDSVLSAFASVATNGNTITGSGILNTQTTTKTIGNTIGQFVTEEYTISTSVAVAADTFGNEITYNITKAGYYPVGIVGWRFSGSGSTRLIAARLRLSAQSAGAGTVSMNPYNITDTATTSVSAYVSVLWVKI